ncbi:hypothetical protein HL667_18690 [Bradyrhizobium sp. 83012]|uniref:Transposase n=1 Tax=Bradyrhizobium aeschynomenes TaxID=2734909 RepID=A0ABX2CFQ0_9BRAD|nr:hypothetical protein [Bradyrhizobium aeschynomenes]NPU10536.1 hypothetical protein [Bradyrhizobium aeschynomenes]NPU67039.1 hypothetical protein [Bradyrhizobium aeschynomenes]NPV19853.1 hypothetical protein [Bradyrhizobium aeschynomenes]
MNKLIEPLARMAGIDIAVAEEIWLTSPDISFPTSFATTRRDSSWVVRQPRPINGLPLNFPTSATTKSEQTGWARCGWAREA